ncbi:MAG TPA: PAAR domain-containing protein [Flavipsychrobacter sp.]|nr:PAAR domain-containing protein [Flavipsychrobacter sp.]
MSKPAARIGDMHTCPMVTPGTPPIPHVGGPIIGPGAPTVLIGGMPAAVMGDMCTCVGPPDTIILGSTGVLIGGKPAARMGDQCAHGGAIVVGCPTVLIGEAGGGGGGGIAVMPVNVLLDIKPLMPTELQQKISQTIGFKQAAETGDPLVHNSMKCADCTTC